MKNMKKILALVLAMLLVASCFAALAATDTVPTPGTGTITINNAAKGETYKAFKVLDASVGANGAIVYPGPVPSDETLAQCFELAADGVNLKVKTGLTDEQLFEKLKTWAATQTTTHSIKAENETVQFTGLEFGYYVVTSTQNSGAVISVTSTDPNGIAYEKNTTTITVSKTNDGPAYSIGDTVTYTVKFNGPNYRGSGSNAQIVTKYVVTDTLPEFLSGTAVTGIKIGGESKTVNNTNFPGVESFGTTKTFDIPWASGNHDDGFTSLYTNNAEIEITYTATLTKIVKVDGTAGNKNIVTIQPYVDKPDGPGPSDDELSDHSEIYTYAAALKKLDGTDTTKTLAGAKFKFNGLTVELAPGYTKGVYVVTSLSGTTPGTEVEVGDDGMLYILGLKQTTDNSFTITGKETVAPAGYNLLTTDVTLTPVKTSSEIWSKTEKRYFDAEGNLVSSTSSEMYESTGDKDVTANLSTLDPTAVKVENNRGSTLPSTGGIGTTLFYVGGGILVLAAVILLVTKKRMSAND